MPVVTLAATDAAAAEAALNPGTFTVTRTGSTAAALTVNYTVGGTASNGADYQSLTGSVVISAGQPTASILVTPIDDSLLEGDETVVVTLSAGATYTLGNPSTATVTIADDDVQLVTLAATDAAAAEAALESGTFTVTRTGSTAAALTVNYTVGGTASNGADYQSLTGSVSPQCAGGIGALQKRGARKSFVLRLACHVVSALCRFRPRRIAQGINQNIHTAAPCYHIVSLSTGCR